jgi:hypothetical protein
MVYEERIEENNQFWIPSFLYCKICQRCNTYCTNEVCDRVLLCFYSDLRLLQIIMISCLQLFKKLLKAMEVCLVFLFFILFLFVLGRIRSFTKHYYPEQSTDDVSKSWLPVFQSLFLSFYFPFFIFSLLITVNSNHIVLEVDSNYKSKNNKCPLIHFCAVSSLGTTTTLPLVS